MSKGLGRVERALLAELRSNPKGMLFDDLLTLASDASVRSTRRALASLERKDLVAGDRYAPELPGRPVIWRALSEVAE